MEALNEKIKGKIRYCTPSVIKQEKVQDLFNTDVSVSYDEIGTLASNSGVFKKAHELASKVYKSDETRFVIHGTTGSNFIVMRTLSKMFKPCRLLCTRNIHKSVWHSCEDFGIKLKFIDFNFDDEFEMFIPPTPEMIRKNLEENPDTNVVLLSNPTYNGLSCKLKEVIKTIREFNNEIIIYVDEAWGSHFIFHPDLPPTAMESGADISVQSTHKQGGSLQQTSMIHWKKGRIDEEKLIDSYCSYTTTSPSYHLLASLDATRQAMKEKGKELIEKEIRYAELFKAFLRKHTKIRIFDDFKDKWKDYIDEKYDKTKILMSLKNYDCDGFKFSKELVKKGIVCEKYYMNNIIFIVTFQIIEEFNRNLDKTRKVFREILESKKLCKTKKLVSFPKTKNSGFNGEGSKIINIERSKGYISAEHIIPYPNGIPLVVKGDLITEEILNYLKFIEREGIHIFKETPLDQLRIFEKMKIQNTENRSHL